MGVDPHTPHVASNGVIDLRSWRQDEYPTVELNGDWGFYPMQLLSPQNLAGTSSDPAQTVQVPGAWHWGKDKKGEPFPRQGYATYSLTVLLPDNTPELALKLIDVTTAYDLYVDGVLLHSVGRLGKTPETSVPDFKRGLVVLPKSSNNRHLIVLQVSNFHYRSSGPTKAMVIGPMQNVVDLNDLILGYGIFLASSIGMIGLYHLGLFFVNRRDDSTLYFGLFCLAIVLRILSTDERYITQLLPHLGYVNLIRIEYGSFLVAAPAFAAFIGRLVPECSPTWMVRAVIYAGLVFGVGVLVTEPRVFSEWLPLLQLYLVLCCSFCFYILASAVVHKHEIARGFFFGFLILALAVFSDILVSLGLLHTPFYLAGAGLVCFIFIQSYALSMRSAQAVKSIEQLTGELEVYSADLEKKVEERTFELEQANIELERLAVVDGLTQIANRRYFEDAFEREWISHRRRGAPLSLIICDIDFFKVYNDTYGHLKGDEILCLVASTIRQTVSRPNDTVARYGGEEFVVLLPDTELIGAVDVAERIRETVNKLHVPHEPAPGGELSLSLGVASMIPSTRETRKDLLEAADQALYLAKERGRNRVETGVSQR